MGGQMQSGDQEQIEDRLHRIEPCSPNSRPGVEPEGLSRALPMVAPEDTFAAVGASLASAPRTPWSECALHTGRFLTSAAWFLWNWPQLHHAPVCDEVFAGWPLPPDAASQDVTDLAPGSRCVSHRAVLWLICSGDERLLSLALERLADVLLGASLTAVGVGGVDQVDAHVQGEIDNSRCAAGIYPAPKLFAPKPNSDTSRP